MGLKLPKRSDAPLRRVRNIVLLGAAMLVLAGCSEADKQQLRNLAMPEPATAQAPYTFELWRWAWVAAFAVGVLVWGLIFWSIWRFRRRSDDEIPVQTRYNLPLEVFYTIAPILMVVVMFFHTVRVQDEMTDVSREPDVIVDVLGQQWSWTFNYTEQGEGGTTPFVSGTAGEIPTLVIPVDQVVQFNLHSPDVIHSFSVPAFLTKLDVIPGRVNQLQVTPTKLGTYPGRCFELCGVYHSRMLFTAKIVSQEDYEKYLLDLQDSGDVADEPILGNDFVNRQAGLDDDQEGSTE